VRAASASCPLSLHDALPISQDAPGMIIAVWRTVFAAAMLAAPALHRVRGEMRAFTRRDLSMIVVGGVFLGLHFVLWIESLYHTRSEEHTSELQSRENLVCRL